MTGNKANSLTLLGLAWPIFLSQFMQTVILNIDTFMLGRHSDQAVAAVGAAIQILSTANLLLGFFTFGLGIILSQLLGAGQEREGARAASITMGSNFYLGALLSILLFVFSRPLLHLINLPAELMEDGYTFLSLTGLSSVALAIIMTAETILRVNGHLRRMLILSFTMIALNTLGNYFVLYEPFGLPSFGVFGVALTTVITRVLGVALAIGMLLRSLKIPLSLRTMIRLKLTEVWELLRLGIPSAGENLSYTLSQVVITMMVTILGTTALTTKIYTQNLTGFVFLFAVSIGQATSIMIGRTIGARQYEQAYRLGMRHLRVGVLIALGVSTLIFCVSGPLISLFTADQEIIRLARILMLLSIGLEMARACNVIMIGALNAAAEVRFPVVMGLISMWGVSIPLAYLFGIKLGIGIPGIWLAFIVDEWLRGSFMIIRWRKRQWQEIRVALFGEK